MLEKIEFATSGAVQEKLLTIILESSDEITHVEEINEIVGQKEEMVVKKEQKNLISSI